MANTVRRPYELPFPGRRTARLFLNGKDKGKNSPKQVARGKTEGAKSGAFSSADTDLSFVVERWPVLTAGVRIRILTLASGDESVD